jgi:hypothetical protein
MLRCVQAVKSRKGNLLLPVGLEGPRKTCYVCSRRTIRVAVDTGRMTLSQFVRVVRARTALSVASYCAAGSRWTVGRVM